MNFEFDKRKSNSNKSKHGIDFEEAQELWKDKYLITVPSHFETGEENRSLSIGIVGTKHWTAITTDRSANTRIISVRRARQQEIELYES